MERWQGREGSQGRVHGQSDPQLILLHPVGGPGASAEPALWACIPLEMRELGHLYTCSCQSRAELLPGWLSPALPACNVGAQKPSKVKKSPQAKKLKKAFGSGPACTRGDMGGGADSARCGHCDVLGGGRGQGSPPLAQKLKQVDPKG